MLVFEQTCEAAAAMLGRINVITPLVPSCAESYGLDESLHLQQPEAKTGS